MTTATKKESKVASLVSGVSASDIKTVVDNLSVLLADTYLVYVKTHNYHWNVVGPRFYELHKMLEDQYNALAESVDVIAERIRMLGYRAPGSFKEFAKLATLEENAKELTADEMLADLLSDYEKLNASLVKYYNQANDVDDQASAGLFAEQMSAHEKTAWMIRSTLAK